jgi:hypothetical protein
MFPWNSDPQLKEARMLRGNGYFDEAENLLKEIVHKHSGSPLAAAAQLELADLELEMNHEQEATRLTEEVVEQYADTPVGIQAANYLVGLTCYHATPEVRLEHDNRIIVHIGGPPVQTILTEMARRDNAHDNDHDSFAINRNHFRSVHFLEPQMQQYLLSDFYYGIAAEWLSLANDPGRDPEVPAPGYYEPKTVAPFRLCHFVRENFPQASELLDLDLIGLLTDIVLSNNKVFDHTDFPKDKNPPEIQALSPAPGESIQDERPQITVSLDDGDIRASQIDIPAIEFTLDGVDLTERMAIRTSYDTSARFDVVFERMRLGCRPATALKPGVHTVSLKVPDHDGNVSEKTWTFIVCARGSRSDDHGAKP